MIPAAVAGGWLFWLAIIDGLAAVYILYPAPSSPRLADGGVRGRLVLDLAAF